jgi:hypothetical protein
MKLHDVLVGASDEEIGKAIDQTYSEIVRHYVLRNWKTAGLDAGHFVEAVRRFLELRLFGRSTPIGKSLPVFNDAELKKYESGSGDDSYRILIPRMLWALYALRNKRSIGHLGAVPAGEIDATALLYGAKWVLSELVRLNSTGTEAETRGLVHRMVERQEMAVWREDDLIRVLDPKIQARDKALIVLALTGDKSESELRAHVQYSNQTNFRKILKRLDAINLIAYEPQRCRISPTGVLEAEKTLQQRGLLPT